MGVLPLVEPLLAPAVGPWDASTVGLVGVGDEVVLAVAEYSMVLLWVPATMSVSTLVP